MKKILEISNICKSFPGVKALDDVSFDLFENEVHCLVGENGAGKSTFIKILSGAYTPDSGSIRILEKQYRSLTPAQALEFGIQTVYQESILVPTLSVAENIFLGNEKVNNFKFIDLKAACQEAKKLIDAFGIDLEPKTIVEDMTTAEKQMVGIIKALSKKARILILDEPTASLSSVEIDRLLKLINEIKKQQVGIIYISHHLEEVFNIGDRITILKDGKKVCTHTNIDLDHDLLIKEMVGRPASLFYFREKFELTEEKNIVEIKNYRKSNVVDDVSFTIKSGEIFGIGGMVGSGRTELVRMFVGVDSRDSGLITYNGRDITPNSPFQALKNGVCLISEGRQKDGLVLVRSILENISLAVLGLKFRFFLNLKREHREVSDISKSLNIVCPNIFQDVKNLSGGNQQKVVLAKWLITNCRIFIFDEPTQGVDIGAKQEIYKIMTRLLKENKVIIMISSDLPELLSMSDRIGIMRKGKMVKILENKDISEEKILSYSIGAL